MPNSPLAGLGVKAADVSLVEDNVLAAAEAHASQAEAEELSRLLRGQDAQLVALRKQERILSAGRFSTAASRQLRAIRARIQTVREKRARIADAAEARKDIRESAPARKREGAHDDKLPRIQEGETEKEFLIRTGKLTPFEAQKGEQGRHTGHVRRRRIRDGPVQVSEVVREEDHAVHHDVAQVTLPQLRGAKSSAAAKLVKGTEDVTSQSSAPRRRTRHSSVKLNDADPSPGEASDAEGPVSGARRRSSKLLAGKRKRASRSGSDEDEYRPDQSDGDVSEELDWKAEGTKRQKRKSTSNSSSFADLVNDADDEHMGVGRDEASLEEEGLESREGDDWVPDSEEEIEFDGGLRLPASVYDKLFDYQKTGVSKHRRPFFSCIRRLLRKRDMSYNHLQYLTSRVLLHVC